MDRHLPGTYLSDGRTLLWVIERVDNQTVLVENVNLGEELEMGDGDLVGYQIIEPKEQHDNE